MTTRAVESDSLVSRYSVELAKVGTWPAVTGPAELTREMFEAMIEASKQAWWDGAPFHIGHFDDRPGFALSRDGDPALGWPEDLRIEDRLDKHGNPYTALVGDVHRIPAGIAPALESMYRKRSIEWTENETGPDGKKYRAVLKGVGLLGAKAPGVAGLADVVDLLAASVDNETKDIRSAFVGDDGNQIVQALSALSDVIRAEPEEIVHDMDQVLHTKVDNDEKIALGGQGMTDTLDAQIREQLGLSTEADIADEIKRLKEQAEKVTSTVETPAPEVGEPTTTPVPVAPEPQEPQPAPGGTEEDEKAKLAASLQASPEFLAEVAEMKRRLDELTAEKEVETVESLLKAASRAGQVAPAELENLRSVMLEKPENKDVVLQVLSARPKGVFPTTIVGSSEDVFPESNDPDFAAKEAVLAKVLGGSL